MTLRDLYGLLMREWDATTAYKGVWHEGNPALNQCGVTALLVQDFFGGQIMRCEDVEGTGSHYFNKLPDGRIVDLTRTQFPPWARFKSAVPVPTSRLLCNPDTYNRYKILVGKIL